MKKSTICQEKKRGTPGCTNEVLPSKQMCLSCCKISRGKTKSIANKKYRAKKVIIQSDDDNDILINKNGRISGTQKKIERSQIEELSKIERHRQEHTNTINNDQIEETISKDEKGADIVKRFINRNTIQTQNAVQTEYEMTLRKTTKEICTETFWNEVYKIEKKKITDDFESRKKRIKRSTKGFMKNMKQRLLATQSQPVGKILLNSKSYKEWIPYMNVKYLCRSGKILLGESKFNEYWEVKDKILDFNDLLMYFILRNPKNFEFPEIEDVYVDQFKDTKYQHIYRMDKESFVDVVNLYFADENLCDKLNCGDPLDEINEDLKKQIKRLENNRINQQQYDHWFKNVNEEREKEKKEWAIILKKLQDQNDKKRDLDVIGKIYDIKNKEIARDKHFYNKTENKKELIMDDSELKRQINDLKKDYEKNLLDRQFIYYNYILEDIFLLYPNENPDVHGKLEMKKEEIDILKQIISTKRCQKSEWDDYTSGRIDIDELVRKDCVTTRDSELLHLDQINEEKEKLKGNVSQSIVDLVENDIYQRINNQESEWLELLKNPIEFQKEKMRMIRQRELEFNDEPTHVVRRRVDGKMIKIKEPIHGTGIYSSMQIRRI